MIDFEFPNFCPACNGSGVIRIALWPAFDKLPLVKGAIVEEIGVPTEDRRCRLCDGKGTL